MENNKKLISDLNMLKNNILYKPLEQNEIDFIESIDSEDYIESAFFNNIFEKIKCLVDKNVLGPKFKTIVLKDKISIYYVDNLYSFEVVKFDLSVKPPRLESIIYDIYLLENDIIRLKKYINSLEQDLNYYLETNMLMKYEIDDFKYRINKYKERKDFFEYLERNINSINFKELGKIRKILEFDLGIDLKSRAVLQNIIVEQALPKAKIYTIGKVYPVKYIQKTKKPGE